SAHHPDLHSFPTRRSSDLLQLSGHSAFFLQEDSVDPDLLSQAAVKATHSMGVEIRNHTAVQRMSSQNGNIEVVAEPERFFARVRSEEHTSELQSQSNLVCR